MPDCLPHPASPPDVTTHHTPRTSLRLADYDALKVRVPSSLENALLGVTAIPVKMFEVTSRQRPQLQILGGYEHPTFEISGSAPW